MWWTLLSSLVASQGRVHTFSFLFRPLVSRKKSSHGFSIVGGGSHLGGFFAFILSPTNRPCEAHPADWIKSQVLLPLLVILQRISQCKATLREGGREGGTKTRVTEEGGRKGGKARGKEGWAGEKDRGTGKGE